MDPYLLDWLHLLARWLHVVAGAAWIGASFYFIWLNNHVRPLPEDDDPRLAGGLWAIHGGAFYKVTKFKGAPEKLPETLHWFKWEAYATWGSGVALLLLVYWINARSFMIDASVADISPATAVAIGVGSLVVGWIVYDLLCRSPLRRAPTALAAILAGLLALSAWGLTQLLDPRAAYMHLGAMMGTMMAANVFFVIIPGQRAMVDAMIEGRDPPVERGAAGSLRSLHNNYLTLPVLFVMISNHFPLTFRHPWNWLILAAICAIGALIRHWFNLHGRGQKNAWLLPAAALAMVSLVFVSRPRVAEVDTAAGAPTTEEIQGIVHARCTGCHAVHPSQPGFVEAPKGLVLETPEQIAGAADRIYAQAVATQAMPLGNLTQMTPEERAKLGAWIQANR